MRALPAPTPVGLSLALLVASGLAGQEPTTPPGGDVGAVVHGVVHGTAAGRRVRLAHAWIALAGTGAGAGAAATSDARGRYVLRDVPPGTRRLHVTRIGYRPQTLRVTVPAGGRVEVDLELAGAPVLMEALTVRAPRLGPREGLERRPGTQRVDVALGALEGAPGGAEAGLLAARSLDRSGPGDQGAALLVRGADADPRQLLLDGAPIHSPFHLAGLLAGIEPGLLARAEHHVGAAPAPFLGGLSRVLALETRTPGAGGRGVGGKASLDALAASVSLDASLGDGAGVLAAARGIHGAGAELVDDGPLPYGYGEALVRADLRPADGHRISATGFWNRESVGLNLPDASPAGIALRTEAAADRARWSNEALSLRYDLRAGGSDAGVLLAGTRYRAGLPLGRGHPAWARGRTERLRASLAGRTPVNDWTVAYGVDAEGIRHRSSARSLARTVEDSVVRATDASVVGGFVEGRRTLGDDASLRAGLRVDRFSDDVGIRVSPRASFTWLLSERASLGVAVGRHYHFLEPVDLEAQIVLDDPGATRAGQVVYPVAGATHLVVSLDQELATRVHLGLEGYVKGFSGLPETAGGRLRSSGMDLRVRRAGEAVDAWLGYSLAWFWDPDPRDGTGSGTGPAGDAAAFRGRHLLTAGLDVRPDGPLGVDARLSYGDGLPLTSVPIFAPEDAAVADPGAPPEPAIELGGSESPGRDPVAPSLDGFLRLDVEIHGRVEREWGGRSVIVRPYLRVLNALERRDALFYYFEPWQDEGVTPLARRPLLPVLGIELGF